MEFNIKTAIYYDVYAPTTFLINIHSLSNSSTQKTISESLEITPKIDYTTFSLKGSKTKFIKLQALEYKPFNIKYQAIIEVTGKYISKKKLLKNTAIFDLKNEIIPFLTPTRHCPSDKLIDFSFNLFGHITSDLEKTLAINEWIFKNIKYVSGSTDANTTAYDTLNKREGVCKDFAHLAIALCRALNIPARYFTCYASNILPPDIHACFEVYLNKTWIVFDPTKLADLNRIVKIAHGKDGSEIAVATLFGNAACTNMIIECTNKNEEFESLFPLEDVFISY